MLVNQFYGCGFLLRRLKFKIKFKGLKFKVNTILRQPMILEAYSLAYGLDFLQIYSEIYQH